jgi:hypothetical protein
VLRLLTSVACVLVVGAGAAVAASRLSAPQEKSAALQRLLSVATADSSTESADPPASSPNPIPARMLGSDVPVPVAPSLLRVRNGWLVSDGRTLVAVYAGAAGDDPSVGRVVVVRQDLAAGRQAVDTLDAGPTGPLTIVAAPRGSAVETSAQTGSLGVRTAAGRALRLDLGTRTLTRPSRNADTVLRLWPSQSSDSSAYSFGR